MRRKSIFELLTQNPGLTFPMMSGVSAYGETGTPDSWTRPFSLNRQVPGDISNTRPLSLPLAASSLKRALRRLRYRFAYAGQIPAGNDSRVGVWSALVLTVPLSVMWPKMVGRILVKLDFF